MAKEKLGEVKRDLPENQKQKDEALKAALAKIHKDFGAGSIMKLGEHAKLNISAIPSGSLTLDMALGVGGFPRGRIIEIYGPESSGKTTLALSTIAEAQKMGGVAAFIDAEHALDPAWAKKLGVDTANLLISQPDYGEQALEITESLVNSGAVDIIVVDSVAALVPKEELDGNMGDKNMALQARLMSQALRKLSGAISKSSCMVIFINQLRDSMNPYGSPETTTGGKALKFYASVRIDIRKGQKITEGKDVIGNLVTCKVVKNKVSPPFKIAEVEMIFGEGFSRSTEIIDIATKMDIIQKSGSWFSYKGERIGQGKDKVKVYFKENPEMMKEIEDKIRENSAKLDMEIKETPEEEGISINGKIVSSDDDNIDPDDIPLDIVVEDLD